MTSNNVSSRIGIVVLGSCLAVADSTTGLLLANTLTYVLTYLLTYSIEQIRFLEANSKLCS
jgi:hypothetical protein